MAELMGRDGTWSFDGEQVRIVPGRERGVHRLRQDLGEICVPLTALAGVAYEPGRKGGRLRLRLRDGADPLLYVTGGGLPDDASPYQVAVDPDRTGVAEYFADEVRQALLLDQVDTGPADRYLLPGPAVPLSAAGVDGTATFDGETVRVEWRWNTSESKKQAGARTYSLADLESVEWRPAVGLESGYLRFRPKGEAPKAKPEHDPNAIELWGFKKESGQTALLAAAVAVRLPHPSGGSAAPDVTPVLEKAAGTGGGSGREDADVLLRRLRELGELHKDGILTAEEFATAKAAVLRGFQGMG
ncbi:MULTISPECIES: DUF4429 domain-containing protein [Streptomyces]|uniref:DUF4429 domain-containing protein n=2 Tax=Streptomyces rimosus subsp. rimosus TaxID=132474 RepID=L8EUX4_STRR1|nr:MULTISPECIES: DUF4429 domain-containing protein [Streptomyces]KOG84204.1 Tat pathway signal sequence domain protein [Kitasatospora aureofaciens]MYT44863.1 DUF4429 domain-containing protein [Streptomyces sp. SID5471]KEF07581.1 hypothetical protein DF17_08495 [Streptomyces rimosus]KEF20393.1 hypothetical protein DF18_12180 [Streptomyces rimosus]KOT27914.1 Tat pathway signal sequence domain protein [Streptomyces sp. NRRL WC-3701]